MGWSWTLLKRDRDDRPKTGNFKIPEASMKYVCLVYHEEEKLAALSQAQMDGLVGACIGWVEELEASGHHIFSAGLQSVRTAATVRHRNGKLSMTDGPFAET